MKKTKLELVVEDPFKPLGLHVLRAGVNADLTSNYGLLDLPELEQELTGIALKIPRKYKINSKELPPSPMGGGPGFPATLWEIIQFAWENRKLIGVILTVVSRLKFAIKNRAMLKNFNNKPGFIVELKIEGDENLDYLPLSMDYLGRCMINMYEIADEIVDELQSKYPLFKFKKNLTIRLDHYTYEYNFSIIKHKSWLQQYRFNRIVKAIPLYRNLRVDMSFSSLGTIKRLDQEYYRDERGYNWGKIVKYYFFISKRVVKDYLKQQKINNQTGI